MKDETRFRQSTVRPFLNKLQNTWIMPVNQANFSGYPDFVLSIFGFTVGLEIKRKGGVLSTLQRYELEKLYRSGGSAIVADPDNWQEVKEVLLQLSKGENKWKQIKILP